MSYEVAHPGINEIWSAACALKQPPSGFDGGGYELMYGLFMMPLRALGSAVRILEIGLGCEVRHKRGPGPSARLKRQMLPEAQLWEAELDGACVQEFASELAKLRITPLVGDQGNRTVLDGWIAQIGGPLDVVIDDGAHTNSRLLASFTALWPRVAPGGLYFFEDINVGRITRKWDDSKGEAVLADVLHAWQEQIIIYRGWRDGSGWGNHAGRSARDLARKWPLPCGVKFIYCQEAACVVGKETARNANRHAYRSGVLCGRKPGKERPCPQYANLESRLT